MADNASQTPDHPEVDFRRLREDWKRLYEESGWRDIEQYEVFGLLGAVIEALAPDA